MNIPERCRELQVASESSVGQSGSGLNAPSGSLQLLLEDHKTLGAVIEALEVHLPEVARRDPETLDLLANLIDYIAEYPDRVHHPREDRIIERLIDKGLTPSERIIVELTVAQHAELAAATARMELDIDALLSKQHDAGVQFDHDARIYLAMQKEHMRREEQQLFPVAVRLFTTADWKEIEASEPEIPDPLQESRLDRYASLLALLDGHR